MDAVTADTGSIRSAFIMGAKMLRAGRASLLVRGPEGTFLPVAAIGIDTSILPDLSVRPGSGIAGTVAERGIPMYGRIGEAAFLSVPVLTAQGVSAVLNMTNMAENKNPDEYLTAALAVAGHLGFLLESNRRLEKPPAAQVSFDEMLERELARSKRSGATFGVALIRVRELAGRDDDARRLAEAIRRMVRPYDLALHAGGDRFCVVLAAPSAPDDVTVERLREAVTQTAARMGLHVDPAVGLAISPADGVTARQLVRAAETRMSGGASSEAG